MTKKQLSMVFSDGFEEKFKIDNVWFTEFKFYTTTNGNQFLHKKIIMNHQLKMQNSYVNIYQKLVTHILSIETEICCHRKSRLKI